LTGMAWHRENDLTPGSWHELRRSRNGRRGKILLKKRKADYSPPIKLPQARGAENLKEGITHGKAVQRRSIKQMYGGKNLFGKNRASPWESAKFLRDT